ncbi:MAG: hypothetical protein AAF717_01550 [Bacteroidota bacterium]
MVKTTTLIVLCIGFIFTSNAQKKRELLEQVETLEATISTLTDSLSKATRQITTSTSRATLLESENQELRDANQTLLQNLTSFSKVSKQSTETVNKALASLKEKEQQMRIITDTFSKNDSVAIAILTQAKQTLGPDAKIGVSNGDVLISTSLDFLFGEDTGVTVSEAAIAFLGKVGQLIIAHPERAIHIEGLNITGEFDVTYNQVVAVANTLSAVEGVAADRLLLLAKDGNFKEGINIRFAANGDTFYEKLKAEFK